MPTPLVPALRALTIAAAVTGVVATSAPALAATTAEPSFYDAGYGVRESRDATVVPWSASGTVTVPPVTCSSGLSYLGEYVTVESAANHVVSNFGLLVRVNCQDGVPSYSALVGLGTRDYVAAFSLSPGDKLAVTMGGNAKHTTVTVRDLTSGVSDTRTTTEVPLSFTVFDAYVEGDSADSEPPAFGVVRFSALRYCHQPFATAIPAPQNQGPVVLGRINAAGTGFGVRHA